MKAIQDSVAAYLQESTGVRTVADRTRARGEYPLLAVSVREDGEARRLFQLRLERGKLVKQRRRPVERCRQGELLNQRKRTRNPERPLHLGKQQRQNFQFPGGTQRIILQCAQQLPVIGRINRTDRTEFHRRAHQLLLHL